MSIFSAMHFDVPSTCQCEKEDRKAEGFQISHFYWSLSNEGVNHVGWLWVLKSWFEGKKTYCGITQNRPINIPTDTAAGVWWLREGRREVGRLV